MADLALQNSGSSVALIKINNLNLILPQGEVRALESVSDIDRTAASFPVLGKIRYAQSSWPVYCLSEEMQFMQDIPQQRRACVLIPVSMGYIGILCDDMIVLKEFKSIPHELPIAMRLPRTPILHLFEYESDIACASNSAKLTAYIEQLITI